MVDSLTSGMTDTFFGLRIDDTVNRLGVVELTRTVLVFQNR